MAVHELTASVSAVSTVTASLNRVHPMAASISAVSTAAGNLNQAHSLSSYVPLRSGYDFAADPHCVSLYNAETWATYLKDQSGESQDLQCFPQCNTADVKEGDGCIEFDNTNRISVVRYTDSSLGSGWPSKAGTSNKTMSIACWFKAHKVPDSMKFFTLIGKYGSFILGTDSANKITWTVNGAYVGGYIATAGTIMVDTWYHVGVTFKNSDRSYRIRVYDSSISGNWADTTGTYTADMVVNSNEVWMGTYDPGYQAYNFDGLIDDLAVFNDVLTAGEIDGCRAGTHNYGTDGDCVAHWSFDTVNFLTDDKNNLPVHKISCPTPDWTVYRTGTASMRFTNTALHPAYRMDTDLSAAYPYKAATTNLDWATCFWLRCNITVGEIGLVSKAVNETSGSVSVRLSGEHIKLYVRYAAAGWDTYLHTTALNADTWYHVVVSINAAANTYLINVWDDTAGTEVEVTGALLHDPLVSSLPWIYGDTQIAGAGSGLDGWMDEIAMFDAPILIASDVRIEGTGFAVSTVTGNLNQVHPMAANVSARSTVTLTNLGTTPTGILSGEAVLTIPPPVPTPWNFGNDPLLWGAEISHYTEEQLIDLCEGLFSLKNSLGGMIGMALTPSRPVVTTPGGTLTAADLFAWIAGTAGEIEVLDDGDGSVTIGLVDPLIVGKGGTGAATLTDHGILLGSGTSAVTPLGSATNGQIPIGSTGADPVLAVLTGTANQVTVTNAAGSITLAAPQDLATASSPQFAQLKIDGVATYIDKDGSGNMTFTDAVTGTRTLKNIGCPALKFIKATGQAEGDLHLSAATWAVSKALIKYIRVVTASTNWSMWILQNDNGYAANDATIPALKIGDAISGPANLWLDLPYQDEDASSEVHLYWVSDSGVDTATIIIQGYELL